MTVLEFTDWAQEYISSKGWNIPVTVCQGSYVRIGVFIGAVKAYDDYSVESIKSMSESALKELTKMNLFRLKARLEALSRSEKIVKETRKYFE